MDLDLEDEAPLACKKAKVVVDDLHQVGLETHGKFEHVVSDCFFGFGLPSR